MHAQAAEVVAVGEEPRVEAIPPAVDIGVDPGHPGADAIRIEDSSQRA